MNIKQRIHCSFQHLTKYNKNSLMAKALSKKPGHLENVTSLYQRNLKGISSALSISKLFRNSVI
jgi:hypothetical protein